jgi:hypothetical protein
VSTTPAAELARVKVRFASWDIRPVEPRKDHGFTAQRETERGLQSVYAPNLADLERQLARPGPRGHRPRTP